MKQRGQRFSWEITFLFGLSYCQFCMYPFLGSYVNAGEKEKETALSPNGMVFLSASELAEKIKTHRVTSLEVVNAYLDHIKKYNHTLNAIVTLDKDAAIQRAQDADAASCQR